MPGKQYAGKQTCPAKTNAWYDRDDIIVLYCLCNAMILAPKHKNTPTNISQKQQKRERFSNGMSPAADIVDRWGTGW